MKLNLRIHIPWSKIMKITFIQIIFATMLTGISYSSSLKAQGVLNEKISLSLQNTTLLDVIKHLEKINSVHFIYSKDVIDLNQLVSVDFKDQLLKNVLDQLLVSNGIDYELLKNRIILGKADKSPTAPKTEIKSTASPSVIKVEEIKLKGTVKDAKGQPLPGVSVKVQGSSIGTHTSLEGDFTLTVPANSTLVFSFIGFTTQEIAATANMNVVLIDDNKSLSEVVVIGYGSQRRGDVTGSVASVKSEDFVSGPVQDAAELLKGKVAGLSVSTTSGDPNAGSQVLLRGNSSILGNQNLLVIIDGVPGDYKTVAPEDIDEISVLKDGSAAAIYGVRGTNGVILITTKHASGAYINQVDYSGNVSTTQQYREPKLLTAQDYRDQIAAGTRPASYDLGTSTDWLKAMTKSLPVSDVQNISFRGGNSQTNYLASLSYRYLNGDFLKNYNQQITGRIDINHTMLDGKLKFNLGILQTNFSSYGFGTGDYEQAEKMNPTAPIREPDGSFYQEVTNFEYQNPISDIYNTDAPQSAYRSKYNATITLLPVEGLRLAAIGSYEKDGFLNASYQNHQNISTLRDNQNGVANVSNGQSVARFLDLTAEYSKSIGDHRFSILAGYEYQDNNSFNNSITNHNFPTDYFGFSQIQLGIAQKTGLDVINSSQSLTNLISYFSRVTYNYKEKYLLLVSVRLDGASQLFGSNQQFGTFPSVSGGWRITKESFMQNQHVFDDLKLRAGYGITGNVPGNSFVGVPIIGYGNNFLYNGQFIQTLAPTQNPNPNLRWEQKHETDIGLDYSMFKGLITGTIDAYDRRITGLLYNFPVPSPPNLVGSTEANVGTMENKGFEVLINVNPIRKKNFSWTSGVTFSTNSNKLVSLSNDLYKLTVPYITTGNTLDPITTFTNIVQVGHPIGDFYGFKVTGISPQGQWIYQEPNGTTTQFAQEQHAFADKQVLGNGIPKYYAGWNNTLRYKNWDFSVTMRGAFGFQLLDMQRMYLENTSVQNYNRLASSQNLIFGMAVLNKNVPEEFNSYYIENGSYWKIDNINLGYTFKNVQSKYIHNPRVYVSSLNTLIITGYKGNDPEGVSNTGLAPGVDSRDAYPSVRTFTLGFSASF